MENIKFPIGTFAPKNQYAQADLDDIFETITNAPAQYKALVSDLTEAQLAKTYRDGAWTIKTLVHHIADMHILHLLRLKMAITETENKNLVIVNINGWANTIDALEGNLEDSLTMMKGTHAKMIFLAKRLTANQLSIEVYHAGRGMNLNVKQLLDMTAWHSKHHLAHINIALNS